MQIVSLINAIKNHPIKALLGSISSVIVIVSALFAVDARYAHAAAVEKEIQETQRIIKETSKQMRQQSLEDKLFELDVRKAQSPRQQLSPIDSALRERYERQLDQLKVK